MSAATNLGKTRHAAREAAMQFLYQCEREKIYYFNPASFDQFTNYHGLNGETATYMRGLVEGAFGEINDIDLTIGKASEHWSLERMPSVDRCVLRLAVYELNSAQAPKKVVINEAIELAKRYGTENSGRFVNGLLDRIAYKH